MTQLPDAPRILLVEDDARLRMELMDSLHANGFHVEHAATLQSARRQLQQTHDLLILDLGLPDGDGLDLCRDLRRAERSIPILMLTARDEPEDRVRGLEVGADDYLIKPFHRAELVARVKALFRRAGRAPSLQRLVIGELQLDSELRQASCRELELDLTPKEFEMLAFFMRHPERPWTRDQLLDRIWGRQYEGGTRTVDLHVTRLRKKIEDDASNPKYLRTVWGVGYRMDRGES